MPRYFTLAEARAALPVVGRSIREAVQAKAHYMEAEKAIQDLTQRILTMERVINVDTAAAEAWKAQYDSNAPDPEKLYAMERIEDLGSWSKISTSVWSIFPPCSGAKKSTSAGAWMRAISTTGTASTKASTAGARSTNTSSTITAAKEPREWFRS